MSPALAQAIVAHQRWMWAPVETKRERRDAYAALASKLGHDDHREFMRYRADDAQEAWMAQAESVIATAEVCS